MAMEGSEKTPLLSKPMLNRKASRRSFASSRRTTIHVLRRKLRRVKSTFVRTASSPTGVDFFSTRLPVEIRLRIYGCLLQFEDPLKLTPGARCNTIRGYLNIPDPLKTALGSGRNQKYKNLNILRVSRLINAEALSVLYELNTISVTRSAFCTHISYTAKRLPQDKFDRALIRNLYVSTLTPSLACTPLLARLTVPGSLPTQLPCVHCDSCLLPFIRSFRSIPRLKEVTIDYHGHADAINKLVASLAGTYGQTTDLRLTCVGVGQYTFTGFWFANTKFELRDVLLAETWATIIAIPRPKLGNLRASFRVARAKYNAMHASLNPRFGKKNFKATARKVSAIACFYNQGMVSQAMLNMWPEDLKMDLKTVNACGREAFLHRFNVEVQRLCGEEMMGFRDMTRRRGYVDPWTSLYDSDSEGEGP